MAEQAVRIGVAEEGRALSSIWRIWRHKEDIYVAVRTIADRFKTSLHGSGSFRHAFVTTTEAERFRDPGLDRAVRKWRRPSEQVPSGTLIFQILIPGLALEGKALNYPLPRDLVVLEKPESDQVLYVSVVETASGTVTSGPQMAKKPTRTLAKWPTEEGGVVWVVSHLAELSEGNRLYIEHQQNRIRLAVRSGNPAEIHDEPGAEPSELRGFILLPSQDNIGQIMDLSLEFLRREFPLPAAASDLNSRKKFEAALDQLPDVGPDDDDKL